METIIALTGLGLMVGLAGAGSAIGLARGGSAVLGMLRKKPELFGNGLVLAGLPATQGLYGFVAFIIYSGDIKTGITMFHAAVVLGAGLTVGIVCLISAIQQANVCASGIQAMGSGQDAFGKTMILAAFPEFYAILALVSAILMKGLLV